MTDEALRGAERLKWVQAILHDCWQAGVNAGPKRTRMGRRDLDPWRNHALPRKPRVTREQRARIRRLKFPQSVTSRSGARRTS